MEVHQQEERTAVPAAAGAKQRQRASNRPEDAGGGSATSPAAAAAASATPSKRKRGANKQSVTPVSVAVPIPGPLSAIVLPNAPTAAAVSPAAAATISLAPLPVAAGAPLLSAEQMAFAALIAKHTHLQQEEMQRVEQFQTQLQQMQQQQLQQQLQAQEKPELGQPQQSGAGDAAAAAAGSGGGGDGARSERRYTWTKPEMDLFVRVRFLPQFAATAFDGRPSNVRAVQADWAAVHAECVREGAPYFHKTIEQMKQKLRDWKKYYDEFKARERKLLLQAAATASEHVQRQAQAELAMDMERVERLCPPFRHMDALLGSQPKYQQPIVPASNEYPLINLGGAPAAAQRVEDAAAAATNSGSFLWHSHPPASGAAAAATELPEEKARDQRPASGASDEDDDMEDEVRPLGGGARASTMFGKFGRRPKRQRKSQSHEHATVLERMAQRIEQQDALAQAGEQRRHEDTMTLLRQALLSPSAAEQRRHDDLMHLLRQSLLPSLDKAQRRHDELMSLLRTALVPLRDLSAAASSGPAQLAIAPGSNAPSLSLPSASIAPVVPPMTLSHSTHVLDVLCYRSRAASSSSTDGMPPTPPVEPYVLVLLNQPPGEFFKPLWENAAFRVCADGGSNRLYDAYSSDAERAAHLPDLIVGDLDSARPEVLDFYAAPHGHTEKERSKDGEHEGMEDAASAATSRRPRVTLLRRDPDQDTTDLDKALSWIMRAEAAAKRHAKRHARRNAEYQAAESAASAAMPVLSPSPPPAPPSPANVEQWGPACEELDAAAEAGAIPSELAAAAASSGAGPAGRFSWSSASLSLPPSHSFFSTPSLPPLRALPVVLYPAFGGRFDQQTAILNAMARHAHKLPHAMMLSEGNLARVLMPVMESDEAVVQSSAAPASAAVTAPPSAAGAATAAAVVPLRHTLLIHPCMELNRHCGLFPLSLPASRVTTRGLQWNLTGDNKGQPLAWGGLLSTSNRVRAKEVSVEADAPLVWTSEITHNAARCEQVH